MKNTMKKQDEIRRIRPGEDPVAKVREWAAESTRTGKQIRAFWQSSAVSYLGVAGGGKEGDGRYPGAVEYVGISEPWSILFFFDVPPPTTETPIPLCPEGIAAEITSVRDRIEKECWDEYHRMGGWYDNLEYHKDALEARVSVLSDCLNAYTEHMDAAKAIWPKQYTVASWAIPAHVLAMFYSASRRLPAEVVMGSGAREVRCRGFDWDILIVSELEVEA